MLGINVFGSNDGTDAIARMFPVVRIDHDGGTAPDRAQSFFGDHLDARIERQIDVRSLLRRLFAQDAIDRALGVAAQITHARFAPQVFVHRFFDVRFSFHVALIKREFLRIVLVRVVRRADVTEQVRTRARHTHRNGPV